MGKAQLFLRASFPPRGAGGGKVAEARKRTGPDDHAGKILEIGSICNRMVQISYLATFKSFCTLGARYEFRSKNLCDST